MNDVFNNPQYFEEDDDDLLNESAPISLEMLRIMCKQYPNDVDLGKVVRNLVKQLKNL